MRLLAPFLVLGCLACSSSPSLVIEIVHPTLVEVAPAQFIGNVPCLDAPGAMRSYSATLFDVTADADAGTQANFALPSSGLVPCTAPIGFAFVVAGHRYAAEVDGYERNDLVPLAPGARTLVDPDTRQTVPPRWTTTCGRSDEEGDTDGVLSVSETTRTVTDCAPLDDGGEASDATDVRVQLPDLSKDVCGDGSEQISRFEVRVSGTGELAEAECGNPVILSDLSSNLTVELELLAYAEGDDVPVSGTLCTATPLSGVTVDAICAPLADRGALEVDLPAVLSSLDLACDAEILSVNAAPEEGASVEMTPPACGSPLRLTQLQPGQQSIAISTVLAGGDAGPTATCSGEVLPALARRASCSPD